jgi:hypothetical protein
MSTWEKAIPFFDDTGYNRTRGFEEKEIMHRIFL